MKPTINALIKITDNDDIQWYGFYVMEDKEKLTKQKRVKLNACLNNTFTINPTIEPKIITNIKRIELTTPEIEQAYHALLIEASEWQGTSLF